MTAERAAVGQQKPVKAFFKDVADTYAAEDDRLAVGTALGEGERHSVLPVQVKTRARKLESDTASRNCEAEPSRADNDFLDGSLSILGMPIALSRKSF